MLDDVLHQEIRHQLAAAHAVGIKEPVLAVLPYRNERADAIYLDLESILVPRAQLTPRFRGALVAMSAADARHAVTQHCSFGGHCIAAVLDLPSPRPDHWILTLDPDVIQVVRFTGEEARAKFAAFYQGLPFPTVCAECLTRTHHGVVSMRLGDGVYLDVGTPQSSQTCRAVTLVRLMFDRSLPSLAFDAGAPLRIPLDDGLMREVLCWFYHGHAPAVAEAIRAIRTLGGLHQEWLLGVLARCQVLRPLYRQVLHELSMADGSLMVNRPA